MKTVKLGDYFSTVLLAGETLTVTADAFSSGLVKRMGEPGVQLMGVQQTAIPASGTRIIGPFPLVQFYSIECAAGSLTYVISTDEFGYSVLKGNVEGFTGSFTLKDYDNGKLFRCDDGSNVTVTVPNNLSQGFNVGFVMWAAGTVTIAAASGATNRSSTSALNTQYNVGSLVVMKQSAAVTAAEFLLGGNFA